MNYHGYRDKSKRKPYICGVCDRDILHPIHQPHLEGFEYVAEPEPEAVVMVDAWPEEVHEPEPQLALF